MLKRIFTLTSLKVMIILGLFPSFMWTCTVNEVGPAGEDGVSDRQIRLALGEQFNTTDSLRIDGRFDLIRFDKRNYVNVDSIIFTSRMRSETVGNQCLVDLFNVTDNVLLESAQLSTDTTNFDWIASDNIFDGLPNKEITLAVIIRSENQTNLVEGGQSFLFLYRDE